MLIPSKPKITWNNVISDKPKRKKLSNYIKSLGTHVPHPPLECYYPQHALTRLMTVIIRHIYNNTIGGYTRNNDRAYVIPRCRTDQLRNSLFFVSFLIKTAVDC